MVDKVVRSVGAPTAAQAPVAARAPRRKVLIAAAECAPLAKSGGLADVVGALPKYLAPLGTDARVIVPFHRVIKDKHRLQTEHLCDFYVDLGWRHQYVGVEKLMLDGATYYLVDNEFYFGGPIYCGGEFEAEQYAFFTRAVLEAIPRLDFDPQVLHCNDWHTAAMPFLLKTQYAGQPQGGLKTLLTLHNLAYQGSYDHGLLHDLLGIGHEYAGVDQIGHFSQDNLLKAGIRYADAVNTVSPTYAREICTPQFGETLEGVLAERGSGLTGILNGIDTQVWDPACDGLLPPGGTYTASDLAGKALCKAALQRELGLDPNPAAPLIAMVGRLTPQKGIDLVDAAFDRLMERGVQLAILGSGYPCYEESLREAESRYPGRVCSYIGYNGALSHRMYAGADLFLMPSAFEPCGISQMIAMRYGALPIVRETGGLRDTVVPYNRFTGAGTGFSFADYSADVLLQTVDRALEAWHDDPVRTRLIEQAMAADVGFSPCAAAYQNLYERL